MKKSLTSLAALALVAASSLSQAQSPAPAAPAAAPAPADSLTYNIGAVTDYRYRGVSQTRKLPALQGGVDFVSTSGFYIGTWGSTIKWIKDAQTDFNKTNKPLIDAKGLKGEVEIDIYGGYKKEIAKDTTLDVGLLQYWYPGNKYDKIGYNANTTEAYGAISYGALTAKLSNSTTPLFGQKNPNGSSTSGSRYLDISYTLDLGGGMTLVPHVGDQYFKHAAKTTTYSYNDFSLALNKDIDGLVISATLIGTNYKKLHGSKTFPVGEFVYDPIAPTKNMGDTALVLGIKKNF
ncbi:MAG: hypothetical protein EXR35_01280 [Limnohabitans sp.]|nr:hypothetical protein [Limnohabitans sp.]